MPPPARATAVLRGGRQLRARIDTTHAVAPGHHTPERLRRKATITFSRGE